MSAQPVDVLAVLDRDIRFLERQGFENAAANMREARAAVAELIEASVRLDRAISGYALLPPLDIAATTQHEAEHAQALDFFRAALARCGGA